MNLPDRMIVRAPGTGRRVSVVGDLYRFFVTGHETGGTYASWEATVPPGGGPPLHIHTREEESFYILEGEMTFTIGEEKITAGPGTFLNLPVGSLHAFRNESSETARMIISIAPAGLEQMFFEVGLPLGEHELPKPPNPEEIELLLRVAPEYGLEIHVPEGA